MIGSQFLEGLEASDVRTVLDAGTKRRFSSHAVIYEQGSQASEFFLLTTGHARYFSVSPEGRKMLLHWLTPGDVVGVAAHEPWTQSEALDRRGLVGHAATTLHAQRCSNVPNGAGDGQVGRSSRSPARPTEPVPDRVRVGLGGVVGSGAGRLQRRTPECDFHEQSPLRRCAPAEL